MSLLEVSRIETYKLEDGRVRHRMELAHHGLNRHRVIRSDDRGIVERKAEIQIADWQERWEKREDRRLESERKEENAEEAQALTRSAQERLERLRNTLAHTLDIDDTIRWEELRDERPFAEPRPERPPIPPEPDPTSSLYSYDLTVLDRCFPGRRKAKEAAARERYEADRAAWRREVEERDRVHEAAVAEWQRALEEHERLQEETNRVVDAHRDRYLSGEPRAVIEYCDLVLSRSDYPDDFPQEFELLYDRGTRTLVVDYRLPPPEAMPTLSAVRYSKSRDEFVERHLSDRKVAELFDDVVYQIALRTIHEMFEADAIEALDSVVFNGRVQTIDPATGQEIDACLVSVEAGREEFLQLRLARVDPARGFETLGGVQGDAPHRIVPVQPLRAADRSAAGDAER